ncbi:MAG: enoyl-CoA hydratase/isomerase family protein [Bacteroidetes bacterium]|nr:enoyl-CoA hydratase/isomerase family protein [Bacteroidota bacterium]
MSSTLLINDLGSVRVLSLNRPEKYNSFNRELARALQAALDDCARTETVRCVVLTGAGKGFCAGQDLSEATDVDQLDFRKMVEEHYNATILRMRNLEKPIIAAVNGVAAGAGANIALAADMVLAARSATFIQAFSKIALIPDSGGTYFLPRLVGMQRALALTLTGDKITAEEALQMGMVYRVYEDEDFAHAWQTVAGSLAQGATKAFGLTKRLINQSLGNSLEEQLWAERELQAEAGATLDFREGVAAFLEKRKAVFVGK